MTENGKTIIAMERGKNYSKIRMNTKVILEMISSMDLEFINGLAVKHTRAILKKISLMALAAKSF